METIEFKKEKILFWKNIQNIEEINKAVELILRELAYDLPENKEAQILIKPNLNNDLNSLTGNSTDLRLIAAVVRKLKERGYRNLLVGDGSNCGTDFTGLDILSRLRIKKLCQLFNISFVNLNKDGVKEITLGNNKIVRVAKSVFDCGYLINLPKIKTHVEAAMTLASKNLIGCFVGMEKRKVHSDLISNIVRINELIKPNLHIVDGLIVMEGDGPATGTPVQMDVITAGKSNFLVDAFCARISGFKPMEIPYLKIAKEKGYLESEDLAKINSIPIVKELKKPKKHLLARIFLRNFFVYPRYWPVFDWLVKKKWVGDLIFKLRIRQDIYKKEDVRIDKLSKTTPCRIDCRLCEKYCPLGHKISQPGFSFEGRDCLECLYCYLVCPQYNIKIKGKLGYLEEHFGRFGDYFKKLK